MKEQPVTFKEALHQGEQQNTERFARPLAMSPEELPQFLERLTALPVLEQQELLDKAFPAERRNEMIEAASEDIHGRKVMYYLYCPMSQLETILTNKHLDRLSFIEDPDALVDEHQLLECLKSYVRLCRRDDLVDADVYTSWKEIVHLAFKSQASSDDLDSLIQTPSYRVVSEFLARYMSQHELAMVQSGMGFPFMPISSISVGGMTFGKMLEGINQERSQGAHYLYLELSIPDDDIYFSLACEECHRGSGEKEVFITTFTPQNIASILVTPDLFEDNTLWYEQQTAVGDYVRTHHPDAVDDPREVRQAVDQWRFKAKTEECLPVSVYKRTVASEHQYDRHAE